MPELIWAEHALADLLAIEDYFETLAPEAAARTIRAIREKAAILERFPEAGPAFDETTRALTVSRTPYALLYAVMPRDIWILRIRHEREDWR